MKTHILRKYSNNYLLLQIFVDLFAKSTSFYYICIQKRMKKVIDIGFGRKSLYELYKSTEMSSRLQYGLVQLEEKYQIEHLSLKKPTFKGNIINNLLALSTCDILFLTYLYPQPLVLLAILRLIGFYRKKKVIGICHVSLINGRNIIETIILKCVYNTFDTILFHSPKNLEESVEKGLIKKEHAEFLFWGDDLDYINKYLKINQGAFFLSTGREQRDFSLLISTFSKTQASLELYTNKVNYDNNYEYLAGMKDKFDNIRIEFVEKSTETTRMLAQRSAECLCIVIPLIQKEIYYCLGLTSVIEAMALGKPIISSRNPYFPLDLEKEGIGIFVDDEQSWINAINYLVSNPNEAGKMGKKARLLAEQKFNINVCSKQIHRLFEK